MTIARAAVALAVLAALACEEPPSEDPGPAEAAPVEVDDAAEAEEPAAPEVAELPPGVDHVVEEGQTLWVIARTYGVPVADIMSANAMRPRDLRRLRAGQRLRIPGASAPIAAAPAAPPEPEELPPLTDGAYHRLGDGETLWDVARLYDATLEAIMERNALDDEAVRRLRPGRALVIPGATQRQVDRVQGDREAARAAAPPRRGFSHTVSRGETIWDLAGTFGVSVAEIMASNGLDEDGVRSLRDGARLWIPGVERDAGGRVRRQLSARQVRAAARARSLGLGSRDTASKLLRGQLEPRWVAAAGRGRLPGHLRWPIANGWFVRGFGSGAGGYHLAVDIMGRIGWNVRAAAEGIVGYAGDEVPGYGNMVLLVHPGGWVTMYAHNSANSVVAGEQVPRGGIVGEVGSTGISRGPHVHFELIHDGQNCDPGPLFRPGVRHRDGRMGAVHRADWTNPRQRPPQVTCHRRRRHPESRWVSRESYAEDERGE